MNGTVKFEYRIANQIYSYDLDNINKEIEFMKGITKGEPSDRLNELYVLKDKKEKQLEELYKKYKK